MAVVRPSKKKKVYIVGGSLGYQLMFEENGWEVIGDMKQADMLQFTGGSDVSPSLYNEQVHPQTYCNPLRDKKEIVIIAHAMKNSIPLAGICRGGQILNVACGGRMWQHVDGHSLGNTLHDIKCDLTGEVIKATSTHHQMMRPGKNAVWVATASECTKKERMGSNKKSVMTSFRLNTHKWDDPEVLYYEKQNVLCFQPHPEFAGHKALAEMYFTYIDELLFDSGRSCG